MFARLTCGHGNGCEVNARWINLTDFPETGTRFFHDNWIIHRPSEERCRIEFAGMADAQLTELAIIILDRQPEPSFYF